MHLRLRFVIIKYIDYYVLDKQNFNVCDHISRIEKKVISLSVHNLAP